MESLKNHNKKTYFLYDKSNSNILITIETEEDDFNIEDFIKGRLEYDPIFKDYTREDIGCTEDTDNLYEKFLNYNIKIDESGKTIHDETQVDKLLVDPNQGLVVSFLRKNLLLFTHNKFMRDFTKQQVYDMYNNDCIGFNLKNMIKTAGLEARFIPIKELYIRPTITWKQWNYFENDKYLLETYKDKLEIGRSVVKIGTYWPFLVGNLHEYDANYRGEDDTRLFVYEGNHRIMSLKLLAMLGEISEDFKVLCIIKPKEYKYIDNELYSSMSIPNPTKIRYVFENVYGSDILEDEEMYNYAKLDVYRNNEKFINEYTVEKTAYNMGACMEVYHAYPIFLRNLIFKYDIEPNKIINNEKLFKEWIEN